MNQRVSESVNARQFAEMMTEKETIRISKFLSLVLRHDPGHIGIALDTAGWIDVEELLRAVNDHAVPLTLEHLKHIVATSDKKRFAFSEDGKRIRASQGHSVEVDLAYEPQAPPELLYHGTPDRFVCSIREKGLLKMKRHHVHLSAETDAALRVGARRGKPVLLTIRAGEMHRAGHVFFRSSNGVWLVEHAPRQFIDF